MNTIDAIDYLQTDISRIGNTPQNLLHKEALQRSIDAIRATSLYSWISVKDHLPKKDGRYLVTKQVLNSRKIDCLRFANSLLSVDRFDFSEESQDHAGWYDYDSEYGYYECTGILAWMLPPEPYGEIE